MKHSRLAALALLLPLAGCFTAKGPVYQEKQAPPEKSVVYLYRPYSFWWQAGFIVVHCGDDSVALGFGGYHKFTVDPGSFKCSTENVMMLPPAKSATVEINAKAGQEYFIRQTVNPNTLLPFPLLTLKSADEAQAEIGQCKEQTNVGPESLR